MLHRISAKVGGVRLHFLLCNSAQTYSQSSIRGIINIVSQETIVQSVQGQTAEFLARIEQDGGKVTQQFLSEIHEHMEDSKEGPTAAFAAIIAIAAAASTAGIGTAAGGAVSGSLVTAGTITANGLAATAISTVVSAGVASLASQAAISLAHNKGDILKAAEKLANSGTLKNMATDVAFAVLIGTPSSGSSVGTHVMHQVRSSFIRMGVEGAIHGKTDRKAWLKKAVINGFASYGASQVGALHRTAVIDQATHKIAHAFIGGMTGKLMYGNKAITPGIIGAFVSESVAELMMPTYGIDKMSAKDKPNYTQEQKLLVHAIAKSSAVLIAAICGFDTEAQIAFAVQTATTSLMFNHGQSVDEARKKKGLSTIAEDEKEDEELVDLSLISHLEKTTGAFRADSPTDGRSASGRKAEREAREHNKRIDQWAKVLSKDYKERNGIKVNEHYKDPKECYQDAYLTRESEIAHGIERHLQSHKPLSSYGMTVITDHARHTTHASQKTMAYVAGGTMIGASATASMTGIGVLPAVGFGAAGNFLLEVANRDFRLNTQQDLIEVGVSSVLGGFIPAPVKVFFPASVGVMAFGYNTGSAQLMIEGGAGALLSAVPFIREIRATSKINVTNAHVMSAPDDLIVRYPANSNMPIKPTANRNVMPILQPQVFEATGTNGLQPLAQTLTGGSSHIAAADIDFRRIYMSSKPSATGGSHIGSSKSATQSTLDSIAGKSAGESLTLDGSGRTLHESGKLHVFRKNDEGRVILSAGEKVSAEDLLRRPMSLKETTARTIESWNWAKAKQLVGEYGKVKGHHVHAKKAFEGHVNYDPKKGFSISNSFMEELGIKHEHITNAQRKFFKELKDSGRPNTIYEHTRIAVDSLVDAGLEKSLARNIVAESLENLRLSNVRQPTTIPWAKKKD